MTILLNKTLRLFLDSIGRRDEYEFYLNKFQSGQSRAFAILCPDRPGFEEVASVFTFDLDFLLRLELLPVILLAGEDGMALKRILEESQPCYNFCEISHRDEDITKLLEVSRLAGRIPVLCYPKETRADALLNLVPSVSSRVHIIRLQGILRDSAGREIFYYYTQKENHVDIAPEDINLVRLAAALLEARPGVHISVASPWRLLQELFTVKGAGCVFRRGSRILRHGSISECDEARLSALMENSFGKKLASPATFASRVTGIYVEENYTGAALLETHPAGRYLSKFAVGTEARGEGLANELWQDVIRDHPALFWRAREDNPVNHWYEKQAEGFHRSGRWRVFWRGIAPEQIPVVIRYSLEKPDDFVQPGGV